MTTYTANEHLAEQHPRLIATLNDLAATAMAAPDLNLADALQAIMDAGFTTGRGTVAGLLLASEYRLYPEAVEELVEESVDLDETEAWMEEGQRELQEWADRP